MLISRNPRGLLNEKPPFIRAGICDCADVPLLNHCVGFRTHAASQKYVRDIFEPAGLFVDEICTFSGPVKPAGDHNLAEVF